MEAQLIMSQERSYNMPGVNVRVAPVEHEIAEDGLDRKHITLEVEKKLVCAGLPVIEKFDGKQAPEFPCLGVMLYVFQPQEDPTLYIFSIEVVFIQRITLAGPPSTEAMRMAWCREATGDITRTAQGFNWSNLYKALEFLVDCFILECFPSEASAGQLAELAAGRFADRSFWP
jgi:hypothetical protein